MEIQGKVDVTIVRGKVVYKEGNILADKGYGKFVKPLNN